MNMFKPVTAKTVAEYIELLPKERQVQIKLLHSFIQETIPSLEVHFASNMLGYGSFKYKNSKKELLAWPVIALASQKNYISIYICAVKDGAYLAEKYKVKLGKVSVGKSCIRFKDTIDLNFDTLKEMLLIAEKSPGLVSKI